MINHSKYKNEIRKILGYYLRSSQTFFYLASNSSSLKSSFSSPQESIKIGNNSNLKTRIINPCLALLDGKIFAFARKTNWIYQSKCDWRGDQHKVFSVREIVNGIVKFELQRSPEVKYQVVQEEQKSPNFEDPRFLSVRKKNFLITTKVNQNRSNSFSSGLALIDLNSKKIIDLDYSASKNVEKNWVPVESRTETLDILYQSSPFSILTFDSMNFNFLSSTVNHHTLHPTNLNNGTSLIQVNDEQKIRIARRRMRFFGKGWIHLQYFLIYDSDLTLRKVTGPFVFNKLGFEVCNGLLILGDDLWLSWTENDDVNYFSKYSLTELLNIDSSNKQKRESLGTFLSLLRGSEILRAENLEIYHFAQNSEI